MTSPIMQFFRFSHLPLALQRASSRFSALAWRLERGLPESEEKQEALRHLLLAKDAAVRAAIPCPASPISEDSYQGPEADS